VVHKIRLEQPKPLSGRVIPVQRLSVRVYRNSPAPTADDDDDDDYDDVDDCADRSATVQQTIHHGDLHAYIYSIHILTY
jgi:hypothetical protein